ncbi:MAG TPA: ABC transporter permease [Verrucomicrobiae bacterium]|nr:ABC transporter permease [Verrucomicrobiae bacterium]
MSLRNIGIVYRKELIDSLRDRRTVVSMIVVPLLVMPLLTIGMGILSLTLVGLAMREIPKVMILGGEDSPHVREELQQLKDVRIVPANSDFVEEISNKQIRAAVEIPVGFEAKLAAGESSTVRIYLYQGELRSGFGADRLQRFFRELRDRTVREHLEARQLPESLMRPFDIVEKNVAPPEKVGGAILGGLVPYFVILLCLTGAMYPAMDLTAGEKERGTIETILCSPVSRTHLVLGKFLMVLTASIATAVLAIASMAVSFGAGKKMLFGLTHGAVDTSLQITITGKAVVSIFFVVLPLAVFFSAALLALSLFAKSFKEAQSYISPLMITVVLPAVAALLPGVELSPALALVPVLNTSLVSKEIITGTFHWGLIALIFLSSSVYAGVAIAVAVKLFQREDVLFRT